MANGSCCPKPARPRVNSLEVRRLTGIWLLAFATFVSAQEGKDAVSPDRVRQVEQDLQKEREAREQLEKRVGELEGSLQKATEALARAHDRRNIDEELEAYLEEQQVSVPAEASRRCRRTRRIPRVRADRG